MTTHNKFWHIAAAIYHPLRSKSRATKYLFIAPYDTQQAAHKSLEIIFKGQFPDEKHFEAFFEIISLYCRARMFDSRTPYEWTANEQSVLSGRFMLFSLEWCRITFRV